jgi:uncharacterized protein
VSAPLDPLPPDSYADFAPGAGPITALGPDPDDPPWGAAAAFALWLASLFILIFVPLFALVGYLLWRDRPITQQAIDEGIKSDPQALLTYAIANLPAHLLTLALVWLLVTSAGRRPFRRTLGWSWGRYFGPWTSAATGILLLLVGGVLVSLFKGGKTPFDEMLESSAAARFATVLMATVTAPLVEELVYRGVLYAGLQKGLAQAGISFQRLNWLAARGSPPPAALPGFVWGLVKVICRVGALILTFFNTLSPRQGGVVWAVIIVSSLFTLVHIPQYYNNPGVIAAVGTLSLSLTIVRAATGRLLPCVVIHAVFNGLQCLALIYEYFYPLTPPGETEQPLPALLVAHAAPTLPALAASTLHALATPFGF